MIEGPTAIAAALIPVPVVFLIIAAGMDSPTGSHHLLTIPREIRNQIYNYLHKSIELRTVESFGTTKVIAGIPNAPLMSVLLTHSQLHDEYRESDPFKNVAAIVVNVAGYAEHEKWCWTTDEKIAAKDDAALTHLKHITLLMLDAHRGNMVDLIDGLMATSPSIHTIMIEEDSHIESYCNDTLPKDLNFPTPDRLKPVPDHFHSMKLRQRANCRWISSFRERGLPSVITHELFQIRTHLYSSKTTCKQLWTTGKLESREAPREYVRMARKVWHKYTAGHVKQRPQQIIGWKEECY